MAVNISLLTKQTTRSMLTGMWTRQLLLQYWLHTPCLYHYTYVCVGVCVCVCVWLETGHEKHVYMNFRKRELLNTKNLLFLIDTVFSILRKTRNEITSILFTIFHFIIVFLNLVSSCWLQHQINIYFMFLWTPGTFSNNSNKSSSKRLIWYKE